MNKSILKKALLIQRNIEKILDADEVLKGITALKGETFELHELDQVIKNIGSSGFLYNGENYYCNEGCNVTNNYNEYVVDWVKNGNRCTITKVTKRA